MTTFWLGLAIASACGLIGGETAAAAACVEITSWEELVHVAEVEPVIADNVVLCPFRIDKSADERISVSRRIHLSCQTSQACIIQGGGNHVRIRGHNAQLTVEGLVFEGASRCAVRIAGSASQHTHTLKDCIFRENVGDMSGWRGGAIKTEPSTSLNIVSSRYVRQAKRM